MFRRTPFRVVHHSNDGDLFSHTGLSVEASAEAASKAVLMDASWAMAVPESAATFLFPLADEKSTGGPSATGATDDEALWRSNPRMAFARWNANRRLHTERRFKAHSLEQYGSMFNRFMVWVEQAPSASLFTVTPAEIERFLQRKTGRKPLATATTRRRYLFLLHHLFTQLVELGLVSKAPTEPLLANPRIEDFDRPAPTVLSEQQIEDFIATTQTAAERTWSDVRDKALRLVFLAAGVTVHELQQLVPSDLQPPDRDGTLTLRIAAHDRVDERIVPVSRFANTEILAWAALLGRIAPNARHLFPGRRFASFAVAIDRPKDEPVSAVECYTIVQDALVGIGFTRARQGPQTLRNSFVARQVYEGRDASSITRWLGLRTLDTATRIGRLVPVRADRLVPA